MTRLPRFVAATLALAAVVYAQVGGVRLVRVPERVELPAKAGTNLIVEVAVDDAATDVRLVRAAARGDDVALVRVDAGRYQLNLADAAVARLLPGHADAGELFVFAKLDGRVLKSPAIAWSRAKSGAVVRCEWVGVDGRRTAAKLGGVVWFDPAKVERLEVAGLAAPQARVVAVGDAVSLPFARREPGGPFVLALNDGTRRGLQDAGSVSVDVAHGGERWTFDLRCVPAVLAPDEPAFTVVQRRRARVPGSNGWLHVRLGDITMGQVLLDVTDATGRDVVAQRSLGEGSHVELRLGGGAFAIVVDELVNRLVGDDHAVLRIAPAVGFVADPIAALIDRVGAAEGVTFLREGREVSPKLARAFLRARYREHRDEDLTLERFVELASKSSRTGEPYRVRRADGRESTAAEWYRELVGPRPSKDDGEK